MVRKQWCDRDSAKVNQIINKITRAQYSFRIETEKIPSLTGRRSFFLPLMDSLPSSVSSLSLTVDISDDDDDVPQVASTTSDSKQSRRLRRQCKSLAYSRCSLINMALALMDPASPGGTLTETKTTTITVTRTTSFTPNLRARHGGSPSAVSSGRLYPDLTSFASSPSQSSRSNRTFRRPSIDSRAGDFPASLFIPTNSRRPLPVEGAADFPASLRTPTNSVQSLPAESLSRATADPFYVNTPSTPPRSLAGSTHTSPNRLPEHNAVTEQASVRSGPSLGPVPPLRQVPSSSGRQSDFLRLNVPPSLEELHPPPPGQRKARKYYVILVGRECGIFTR